MSKRVLEGSSEDASHACLPSFLSTSEQLTLKVMSIMKEAYKSSPRELWGLSRSADLLAPRGFLIRDSDSYKKYIEGLGFTVVRVRITGRFDEPISLLPGVKILVVGIDHFNSPLTLCSGIEEVTFMRPSRFDQPITLPPGLKKVVLGQEFNRPITLPSSLTEVVFAGYRFDHPLILPFGLEVIEGCPNHPVILPFHLRKATFKCSFNHPVTLGPNMEELEFGGYASGSFNHPLDLTVAPKLCVISFGDSFNMPVELPESLEEAKFGRSFNYPLVLPPLLKVLKFDYGGVFNHPLTLVDSLRVLHLSDNFNHPIDLPDGLEDVTIRGDFNFPIIFPGRLKKLTFIPSSHFNHPIMLPDGLTHAWLRVRQSVTFPLSLQEIKWYSDFIVHVPEELRRVFTATQWRLP